MRLTLFFLAFATALTLNAQTWAVPENVTYERERDYIAQSDNIVAAANYLIETPVGEIPYKRKMTSQYVMVWASGTPTMTMELNQEIAPFMTSGECLMVFMASYSKHSILDEDAEAMDLNYRAVKDVLRFYEANEKELGEIKSLEKFQKLEAKGKLEAKIHKAS